MPTIMTHAAVPLAMYLASDHKRISPRLLTAGIAVAMLPDADVLAFALHIPYADNFGHRGASHSILFATIIALTGSLLYRWLRGRPAQTFTWLWLCALSHPLLDAFTSGGLGVALAWPWSEHRFFSPWRPILVSPFAGQFFNLRGLATLRSEFFCVWLPLFFIAISWKLINQPQRQQPN